MDDLKDELTDATTSLGDSPSGIAHDLQNRAKDAWDSVQHRIDRVVRESSAYVQKNPMPTALVAFAIGLVLGVFLNRRAPRSFKDRYIGEPLHQSRGALLGLLFAFATLLRRAFSSAFSATEKVAERVGDDLTDALKPLSKAGRKAGATTRMIPR
jgi:ElaB/YqjD/DUF883 family membrane-anchored ribosome-binding protein